jgi:hypothetical protein
VTCFFSPRASRGSLSEIYKSFYDSKRRNFALHLNLLEVKLINRFSGARTANGKEKWREIRAEVILITLQIKE